MAKNTKKDKEMAAYLRKMGVIRTKGICPLCYRLVSIDSSKSRYKHICHGGR